MLESTKSAPNNSYSNKIEADELAKQAPVDNNKKANAESVSK